MHRDELAAWLRLALTPSIGNATARRLLAAFGLPQAVFGQPDAALGHLVSAQQAQSLRQEPEGLAAQVDAVWRWLEEAPERRRLFTLADADYPATLLNIEDPPLLFYALGQVGAGWPAAIAVVGSRNPTPSGLTHAREFSHAFAQAGLTVVSGMALGVDGAAHEGALQGAPAGQLATIAVVGTGLDRVYPRRHLALAHRIAQAGMIISEYPLGTPPLPPNFPRRNRIISALSRGTLVVEAALKSGSLITARQASEQGKDVFAIPGSIQSLQSRGCHALLKEGAKLVESAQDVLEEFQLPAARKFVAADDSTQSTDETDEEDLPDPEDAVLAAVGFDPVSLDALVARTGMAPAHLQAKLLELELQGDVTRLPGGLFQRVGAA